MTLQRPHLAPESRLGPALYSLAIGLPFMASLFAANTPSFYAFPSSLHFLILVVIASLGGFGPGLLCFASCVAARLLQAHFLPHPPLTPAADFFRFCLLLATTLLLGALSQARRRATARLALALHDLEARSADLMASLTSNHCACWHLDLDSGQSARWFHGSYEVFGRPFDELERLPSLITLLHPEDQPRLTALVAQMRSSAEPVIFEHRVLWPNGDVHTLEMRAARVSHSPCCWRGVTLDITQRKLSEAALLRAEKLAAMGRLASTVAHEINNPLEAVTNLLYLVSTGDFIDPVSRDYLATAEKELARLSNITRLTLGFVRTNAITADLDLAATVDDVLAIFQHRLDNRGVRIDRHYQAGVRVLFAPHELRQVATNLIANALDAIASPTPFIALDVRRQGELAIFTLDDNGSGIDAHSLPRIFEPFFSTKQDTGTGIGLWVTRELVEKYDGRISVESSTQHNLPQGVSTRFRIELPLSPAPAPPLPTVLSS